MADSMADNARSRFTEVWDGPSAIFGVPAQGPEILLRSVQVKEGGYLPAVSTRQTTEAEAIEVSFQWLRDGKPAKIESASSGAGKDKALESNSGREKYPNVINISISMREALRDIKTPDEAEFICRELKKQGFLKTYVVTGSRQDEDFGAFLQAFWDYENSPYIKEKLRKNHGIHKNYTKGQKLSA